MKAKELKIGDLVSFKGTPVKVCHIDPPYIYAFDEEGVIAGLHENCNNFDPIPLTSEILKKNGWRERKHSEYTAYENGWYELFRVGQEGSWAFCHYDDFLASIEYIHELQHLLWALGMDDDLKI